MTSENIFQQAVVKMWSNLDSGNRQIILFDLTLKFRKKFESFGTTEFLDRNPKIKRCLSIWWFSCLAFSCTICTPGIIIFAYLPQAGRKSLLYYFAQYSGFKKYTVIFFKNLKFLRLCIKDSNFPALSISSNEVR